MALADSKEATITKILDYWFSFDAKGWFMQSSEMDKTITDRFGVLVEKARLTDELDSWADTPWGTSRYLEHALIFGHASSVQSNVRSQRNLCKR